MGRPKTVHKLVRIIPKAPVRSEHISCIYKIWFGDSYYVGRAKLLSRKISTLEYDLSRYLPYWSKDFDESNYYVKVLNYLSEQKLNDNGEYTCFYEIVLEENDDDKLLQAEKAILEQCQTDEKCLNTHFNIKKYERNAKKQ